MRIALVTYALQLGGVETFLHNLGGQLRASGHDVEFIETEQKGVWSDLTRQLGFEVISAIRRPMATRARHAETVAGALHGYDALLINDSPLAMAALSALPSKTVAIPILHTKLPSMIRNATANLGQWQRIATVAPGLRERMIESGDATAEEVVCIPNGVPTRMDAPSRQCSGAPLKVVYVGRIEQGQKNVLAIPRILAKALHAGASLTLDVIGEGPDEAALEAALRESGTDSRLHGRLSREGTLEALATADVLLMPSFYEGLPMTLLEAMARGVTPVASRLAGSTDCVVESGANGFLAEPSAEEDFAEEIASLSKDRDRLARMSRRAWETVRSRFSVEVMTRAYIDLIHECRQEIERRPPVRSGRLHTAALGDLAGTPYSLVRPWRKTLRLLGLYPPSAPASA